jgi:hypothetical protein
LKADDRSRYRWSTAHAAKVAAMALRWRGAALRAALLPGALSLGLGMVVILAGLLSEGGGLSRFVHAGAWYVTPRPHLVRQAGAGYDGQFVYRLALAPSDLGRTAHGITLDTPLRLQRIGLSALAWVLSGGGRAALVPAVLVVINLLALAALGALGGLVCRRAGRNPAWGVLLASSAGLTFSLLHDLTEVLSVALLITAVHLIWSRRPVAAGFALAGAALTRETALLLAAGIALPRLLGMARRPARLAREDLAWALPVAAFVGWQLVVALVTGQSPLGRGGGTNLSLPFVGLVGLARSLPSAALHQWPLLLLQLAFLVYLLVAALPVLRESAAPVPLTWLLAGAFSLCYSTVVWTGYDDLRSLTELSALTMLVLLRSRRSLSGVATGSAIVWVVTLAVHLG